jgi:sugar/nucleoside kinase (ribokinase family)
MAKRVLVIGELNVDLIVSGLPSLPALGQELVCTGLARTLGSSSAICSRALAGLGAQVGFMGKVGDDENGRFMMGQLEELEIDTTGVIVDPAVQTGITISLTYPGEKAQVTFPGSIAAYRPDEVDLEAFTRYDHLHLASMFLQTALRPAFPALLHRARELGLSTSLDPGWDPAACWGEDLYRALKSTDILFLNEHEAKALTARASAEAALQELSPRGALAVCKLGPDGALMMQGGEVDRIAAHRVPVVDTTGGFVRRGLHLRARGRGAPGSRVPAVRKCVRRHRGDARGWRQLGPERGGRGRVSGGAAMNRRTTNGEWGFVIA